MAWGKGWAWLHSRVSPARRKSGSARRRRVRIDRANSSALHQPATTSRFPLSAGAAHQMVKFARTADGHQTAQLTEFDGADAHWEVHVACREPSAFIIAAAPVFGTKARPDLAGAADARRS